MTTSDYLESLQDDLSRTVTALELEEGTNFTDIADMAENGDISTGGGDISEYFETETGDITSDSTSWAVRNFIKKVPDLIVSQGTRTSRLFQYWLLPYPKVICGDNITQMDAMYVNESSGQKNTATTIDLSGLNTSNVTLMNNMFQNCSSLTSLDLSNFNTSNVTNMSFMFSACSSLTSLNLSNFNTSNVTAMNYMFSGCRGLTSLNVSNFNTTKVTNMNNMFSSCLALTSLDLSNFVNERSIDVSYMFAFNTSLAHIDLRNFNFTLANVYANMFGASASNGVPDNCLIIVKDQTQKDWINTKFSRLTNVQTVEEYEASLNS